MTSRLTPATVAAALKSRPVPTADRRSTLKLILSLEVGMPGQSEPTLFSTAALNLPKTAAWPMPARGRINRLSAKGTGRVLFAIVDGRITAAIGFTLKFKPIVAYVLAAEAELPAQGLRNLRAAKACLHYMAAALRRPPEVYFDAPPQTVTIAKDRLLFKDAGAAHDVRAAGKLLVQGAPDEGA